MKRMPNSWLIILNDFLHDLFTGLWFGAFVTFFLLRVRLQEGLAEEAARSLNEVSTFFKWFALAALLAIVATGIFRFFYYRDWDGRPDPQVKKRMLIIKHAVLGTAFLGGTLWLLSAP